MDDEINQLDSILDGTGTTSSVTTGITLDTFAQMGDGSIVKETFNQPDIGYSLLGSTTLPGTSTTQPNLDQFGRVQDMVWSAIGSGAMLDGYGYSRNLQGDVGTRQNLALDAFKIANPSATAPYLDQVFSNDAADQLTALTQGQLNAATDEIMGTADFSQGWTLDGNGNATAFSQTGSDATNQTRTPTVTNEIGGISTTSGTAYHAPGYDAAGNMTTVPQPGNETVGLTSQFDAWDRLAAVYSSSTLVASYAYNGQNQLIATASDYVSGSPQSVTFDYYAGTRMIEQRVATGSGAASATGDSLPPTYQYVWSANGGNAPILRDTYSSGSLVSADRIYFLTDANDNVTAITDNTGAVLERYSYSAFGGVTVYSATWTSPSSTSSYGNAILFAGMQLDPTTGLYYDNARWFNSSLGTFITTDPAHSSANLYAYAGNDPIGAVDPSGMYGINVAAWSAPGDPAAPATPAANPSCGSSQGPGELGLLPTGFPPSGGMRSPASQLGGSGDSDAGAGGEGGFGDEASDDSGLDDDQAAAMIEISSAQAAEVDREIANAANAAPSPPVIVATAPLGGTGNSYYIDNTGQKWYAGQRIVSMQQVGTGVGPFDAAAANTSWAFPFTKLGAGVVASFFPPSEPAYRLTLANSDGSGTSQLLVESGGPSNFRNAGQAVTILTFAGPKIFGQPSTCSPSAFSNCFPAGTPVSTPQGLISIEKVKAGNDVWAFDLVAGEWKCRRVVETYENDYVGYFVAVTVADETINATSGHPFWVVNGRDLSNRPFPEHIPDVPVGACVPGRWVDAGNLQIGDTLLLKSGHRWPITKLATHAVCQKVYNFHVDDLRCYAVGNGQVLVHNNSAINNLLNPGGNTVGVAGSSATIREVAGSTAADAQSMFGQLSQGGTVVTGSSYPGTLVQLPGGGTVGLRTVMTNSPGTIATIDVNVPGVVTVTKIKFNP